MNNMPPQKTLISALVLTLICVYVPDAAAMTSPAPMDYYHRGEAYIQAYRGDDVTLHQASQEFVKLIDRFPDFPLGYLGLSQVSIIHAYRFDKYHQMDQIRNEAMPLAVRALELGPLMPVVHLHYDLIQDIFDKHRQHQQTAQKFLTLLPDEPETFFELGQYLLAQDDYDKSREFYEAALEFDPDPGLKARIYKRLGYISLRHLGAATQAIDYYQRAVQLSSRDDAGLENLGQAYFETGEYRLALDKFNQVYQKTGRPLTEYYILLTKGYLFQERGQTDKAIIYFERALQTNSNTDSQLYYYLGNLYFQIKDYAQAFQKFKKVIELKPYDYSDIYYLAGRSAYSLGDNHSALDYFKKHLQQNNTGTEAEWIRAHIPNLSHK